VNRLGHTLQIFIIVISLCLVSPLAFSDDCKRALTILSGKIPGIVSSPNSLAEPPRGNPHSLNSPHHPEYLKAKLPPKPKLKYQGISFSREGEKATLPAWSEEHYIAVEGDKPYVYKVNPRTQKLELVKNNFDSVKDVEKGLSWGPHQTLVAAGQDGSVSLLRLNPETKILSFLSRFKTGGWISADPAWGPDGTLAVTVFEKEKNSLMLLKFNPETNGVELLDKREMPDYSRAKPVWRPDGTIAIAGDEGHLSILRLNPETKKLDLLVQKKVASKITATPSWGPNNMLAVGGRDHTLSIFQLNPDTHQLELRGQYRTDDNLQRDSPSWGPDNMLAFVGNEFKLYVVRLNPETKKTEELDIKKIRGPFSTAWGPEGTLAIASWNSLSVFKWNSETKKLDLLDTHSPRDSFYLASLAWGPNATVVVNSLTGTYTYKLVDGRSWFSTISDLFKSKTLETEQSQESWKLLDIKSEEQDTKLPGLGVPGVWSELLEAERKRVKQ